MLLEMFPRFKDAACGIIMLSIIEESILVKDSSLLSWMVWSTRTEMWSWRMDLISSTGLLGCWSRVSFSWTLAIVVMVLDCLVRAAS